MKYSAAMFSLIACMFNTMAMQQTELPNTDEAKNPFSSAAPSPLKKYLIESRELYSSLIINLTVPGLVSTKEAQSIITNFNQRIELIAKSEKSLKHDLQAIIDKSMKLANNFVFISTMRFQDQLQEIINDLDKVLKKMKRTTA